MKKFLGLIALLALSTSAFAHQGGNGHHRGGKKKFKMAMVKGEKAQAIFEALAVESVTVDKPKRTLEVKKIGGLKCVQGTKLVTSIGTFLPINNIYLFDNDKNWHVENYNENTIDLKGVKTILHGSQN